MGNTNGREEGDNEEDPNRGSIDTDDYEVDGLPPPSDSMLGASNSPPSRSPLMFAPQLPVAPLQRGDAPPTFNHIWINDPHNSLDAPQEQGIPTLITWTFGGKLLLSKDLGTIGHPGGYCRGQERTTPFSWCFHLVYISTGSLWMASADTSLIFLA